MSTREYRLILRDEGDAESRYRRLRAALKYLLRVFRLRNIGLEPISEERRGASAEAAERQQEEVV